MSLGDIHSAIKNDLARGDTLDSIIPDYVKRAAKIIELNHTFQYMLKFGQFTVSESADQPRVIAMPNDRVKFINMIRYPSPNSSEHKWVYITGGPTKNEIGIEINPATGYRLNGVSDIVLDNTPDQDYEYEIEWAEFTSWPIEDSASNWLILHGESALINETLVLMAARLRDNRLAQMYVGLRQEAFKVLMGADDDMRYVNQRMAMRYNG